MRILLLATALLSGCAGSDDGKAAAADPDGLIFPFEGAQAGKEDVFGRSLVGAPSAFVPDADVLADPVAAEAVLVSDMRARRDLAWKTVFKVLEPAPLLGLASQLEARPDCAAGVSDGDLKLCSRKRSETECAGVKSGEIGGICVWDAAESDCGPSCDRLSLPDGQPIPTVPRWTTWYGVEDINRIFRTAYGELTTDEQVARAPLTDAHIGRAFLADHSEIERSNRWPLHRYTKAVVDLFGCDLQALPEESPEQLADRCAMARQSQFSGGAGAGGGIARLVYSPAMVLHVMRNYAEILQCKGQQRADSWCEEGQECGDPPGNFAPCYRQEFPADAGHPFRDLKGDGDVIETAAGLPAQGGTAILKATWTRVGFGVGLPAFDTDADALAAKVGPGKLALWGDAGDRTYDAPADPTAPLNPGPDGIYTIANRAGSVFRLTGLHIMTKELRHWQWITLWWSDKPDSDFGEDRPASFEGLPSPWRNYKMCVVVDYTESDPDPAGRYPDFPSLQAALAATQGGEAGGGASWCSNPYIEHGAGNARTNCIGCHQHAGSAHRRDGEAFELEAVIGNDSPTAGVLNPYPANGRLRVRNRFASDYSWAFSRLDDLTELIRREVEQRGARDDRWLRINAILTGAGDVEKGEAVFRGATADETCTDCHGEFGQGDFGPNLEQVFAQKTQWQLMATILEGRGDMPAWGERMSDEQLTDLFAYLRANFALQSAVEPD